MSHNVLARPGIVMLVVVSAIFAGCSDSESTTEGGGGSGAAAGTGGSAAGNGGASQGGSATSGGTRSVGAGGTGGDSGTAGDGGDLGEAGSAGSGGTSGVGGDSGTAGDGGDGSGGTSGDGCNELVNNAPTVQSEPIDGVPSAEGGTIASGAYELTSIGVYQGDAVSTRVVIEVSPGIIQLVRRVSGTDLSETYTYAAALNGAIVLTRICGDQVSGLPAFVGFTVTDEDDLLLIGSDAPGASVWTLMPR